jgi:hypothetical protein
MANIALHIRALSLYAKQQAAGILLECEARQRAWELYQQGYRASDVR